MMKRFKLLHHQKTFSEESLIINPKDFPSLSAGNIVQICSTNGDYGPLLLEVNLLPSDPPHKGLSADTISIEQSIASGFQLKNHSEVLVSVVDDIKAVSLDSIEITFKDQYLARSDMWRLKKCLVNSCVYVNKKLEIYGIRCQVFEMYIQGDKVTSGVVAEDTKIVYRSASSMVYLFIQMSCEMWHFDINGDLYFEKAINGFLPELFSKWKKHSCNHDVTIVLFSRTFYEAHSREEFPECMRDYVESDYKGRFYEDFYRVAVQNERYEDWSSTIISLKKLFNQYLDDVLHHHEGPGVKIPKAVNSTSSQGNFLEVLNMSLNVFEKHYLDRSFDRTGQLSVVISPGVGVFDVDRELTVITKQRIIDNGIGSDLVCLGEQPLHAVPLFKFINKKCIGKCHPVADDYNMPHWINLSFYSSSKQTSYSNFTPRVKLPIPLPEEMKDKKHQDSQFHRSRHASQPDPSFAVLFDYDEYDNQVFKLPASSQASKNTSSLQRPRRRTATPPSQSHSMGATVYRQASESCSSYLTTSDPSPLVSHSHASSAAIAIPTRTAHLNSASSSYQNSVEADTVAFPSKMYSKDDADPEFTPPCRTIIGSAGSPHESHFTKQLFNRRSKALVNPFDPSHITIKLTSNRRRWTHVFPLGPTGIFMQQHHYQAIPQISASTLIALGNERFDINAENLSHFRSTLSSLELDGMKSPSSSIRTASLSQSMYNPPNRNLSWLWGATGEQEWTPALTTGVDWKSLVIPACLPITTDYFPDKRSLQNDYVLSDYYLFPEDIIAENSRSRTCQSDDDVKSHRTMTTLEVYNELICQRLQQGFQIILLSKQHPSYPHAQASTSPQFSNPLVRGQHKADQMEEYLMSIGRIFHKLTLDGSQITVVQYRPRHPYREIQSKYHYQFRAPDSDCYTDSCVVFKSEKLENYGWNYLDHYICMKGEGDFELKESLKYWRLRMLLLPGAQAATRKIIEGAEHCDLYTDFTVEEKIQQREGFLKFVEVMNKIQRLNTKSPKLPAFPFRRSSLGPAVLNQIVRDRVNSNRVHDRPRFRSVSARMGARVQTQPVMSGRLSPAGDETKFTSSSQETSFEASGEVTADTEVKKLNGSSTHSEIVEAMKQQDGLNFLIKLGLPPNTFISAEAIAWALHNIDGISMEHQALQLFQALKDKGLICHASGNKDFPFVHGFYLYYLTPPNGKGVVLDGSKEESFSSFQRDWLEVELHPNLLPLSASYEFSSEEELWSLTNRAKPALKFKRTNIQIDERSKSGRLEWGQARYHSIYEPYEAFEIIVEWMVATGNIAAEMVQGWARKANPNSLQLVPIPSDPFAVPSSYDTDPLRGPIVIPLDLSFLIDFSSEDLDRQVIVKFQEKILCKFGFLPYRDPESPDFTRYVHISGSMFIMLLQKNKERDVGSAQASSLQDEYVSRHYNGGKNRCEPEFGFLYSWNYMITKRWKNTGTVDEHFMRKVMRDFRLFCTNQDQRLEQFWKVSLLSDFKQDPSMVLCLEA